MVFWTNSTNEYSENYLCFCPFTSWYFLIRPLDGKLSQKMVLTSGHSCEWLHLCIPDRMFSSWKL